MSPECEQIAEAIEELAERLRTAYARQGAQYRQGAVDGLMLAAEIARGGGDRTVLEQAAAVERHLEQWQGWD